MNVNVPAFDLVLATIGRTTEMTRFLDSLAAQTVTNFRLIVVDQNEDERVEEILSRYAEDIRLTRVTSEPGLSRARNVGLRHLEGDVVSFPDDDCWYPPDLLQRVADDLARHPDWHGATGRTVDEAARSSFVLWQKEPGLVTRQNVWGTAVAVTMFLRRAVVEQVGSFDESLGAGSGTPWRSGEETDYTLRALAAGFTIGYDPDISVFHESPRPQRTAAAARKGYFGGMGQSRVLRKHRYPWWFAGYRVLQLVAGSAFFLVRGRLALARFYWAMARGRAVGWIRGRERLG
jgi:glycosyltransferase involved in cell wall biosynthesis